MPFGNNPTQMDILSTPYGLSGQMSPEIAVEQQALNRKQQIANMLLQQGMQPAQGQMVGRFYVPASPFQHLGNLAQVAAGAFGTGHLDDQRKGLLQQQQQIKADAIRKFMEQTQDRQIPERTLPQGSPEQVIPNQGPPQIDDSKNYGMAPAPTKPLEPTVIPAVPPTQGPVNPAMTQPAAPNQRRQAIIEAMTSQVPGMREAAQFLQQQEALQAQRDQQKAYQDESLAVRREGIESNAMTRAEMIRGNMLNTQAQIDARLQAGRDANDLKAELARQNADLQKLLHGMDNKTRLDVAQIMADSRKDVAGLKAEQKGALPTPALKMQQEELDAIGTVSSINADLGAINKQIQSGSLKLGLLENIKGTIQNKTGLSTESSRNLASFKATLEKLRNDSLRLNKGVQTEGDAVRAWNELIENINDPKLVSERINEIAALNDRASNMRKLNIDNIRKNYGAGPLETSGYEQQPAAIGSDTLSKDEQAELDRLRKKYGR